MARCYKWMKCKPTIASFSAARRFLPRFFPTPAVSNRSTRFRWRSRGSRERWTRSTFFSARSFLPELPSRHARGSSALRARSAPFNNHSGEGSKLVISVFAVSCLRRRRRMGQRGSELTGTLCKSPNRRTTPMGREICDLMLAVNRLYGRSDYLPCIVWGQNARRAALWDVGTRVHLLGRIQSREYIKNLDGQAVRRTAYEISVSDIAALPAE